jgi:Protein of unknown function (DUF4065)
MAELKDIMTYLISHYPKGLSHELSNARLTKMVYLSDWHQAINYEHQISKLCWYFDNYGPFVKDIEETALSNPGIFSVANYLNQYGQPKKIFKLKHFTSESNLLNQEKASLNHIILITQKLYWNDFIKLVYSTHPVASSERYTFLNLIQKAREYKQLKKEGSPDG